MNDHEIDINTLKEFHESMSDRVGEVEDIIAALNDGALLNQSLPSGTFTGGETFSGYYEQDRQTLVERMKELKQATEAIKDASKIIAEQYTTTEEQNTLNSEQVGGVLDGAGVVASEGDS